MTYIDCTCHPYELKLCKEHGTMTNHIGDKCMKCDPTADIKPSDAFWYYLMYAPESNEDRIKYWEAIEDDVEKMFTQEISQAEQRIRDEERKRIEKIMKEYLEVVDDLVDYSGDIPVEEVKEIERMVVKALSSTLLETDK